MSNKLVNWFIFSALSLIWGSSFILMKQGLVGLNAYQVASLRILSSGIVLLPVAVKNFKHIPTNKLWLILLSAIQGSLLPAYLFCLAEEHIDSSLAGTLNALTPVFVILGGTFLFGNKVNIIKIAGVGVSLFGSILLFFAQPGFHQNSNIIYVLMVVLATLFYGVNVNMVGKYLKDIPSLHIAAVGLSFIALPALMVLCYTGYFNGAMFNTTILTATMYSCILGIGGTAIATILFYILLKRAGAVFASMVTYGIPIVAVTIGVLFGEIIGWKQVVCLCIILSGVYIANTKWNFFKLK